MKTLILILSLALNSFAQTSLEECATTAKYYGHKSTPQDVPQDCFESIKALNQNMKEFSEHTIAAYGNLLYVESGGLLKLTSGSQTLMNEALALDAAPSENLVFVLNKKENTLEVLSFPLNFGGNIAPRRRLATDELESASSIKVDTENKKIYAMSKEQSWIKVFNQNADPNGKRTENSNKLLRLITGISPIDMAITSTELLVLTNREIIAVEKDAQGEVIPQRARDISEFGNPKSIRYDAIKNELELHNSSGDTFRISDF